MSETDRPRSMLRSIGAGPKWYALAVIAIALPCAWAGGRFFDLQMRGQEVSMRLR